MTDARIKSAYPSRSIQPSPDWARPCRPARTRASRSPSLRPDGRPRRLFLGLADGQHLQPALAFARRRRRPYEGVLPFAPLNRWRCCTTTSSRSSVGSHAPTRTSSTARACRAGQSPVVVQVPDFGDRFWVYQIVDLRTDSFAQIGAMYGTTPGFYLLGGAGLEGEVPKGLRGCSAARPHRVRRATRLPGRHVRGQASHPSGPAAHRHVPARRIRRDDEDA